MNLLEINKVSRYFGGLAAIHELDLEVCEGEIRGLIGPNGAGKTTLFNIISGTLPPTNGRIIYKGKEITHLPIHKRVESGIIRTFQQINLFSRSSVYDNVYIGNHIFYRIDPFQQVLHTRRAKEETQVCHKRTMEILELMGLAQQKSELARNLPHGHQRILGMCIALAGMPKLLLLDEPMSGLTAEETMELEVVIRNIRNKGVTIMVVEHNIQSVMNLCDRISVLNFGTLIAEGTPGEIKTNPEVIEAYLGRVE